MRLTDLFRAVRYRKALEEIATKHLEVDYDHHMTRDVPGYGIGVSDGHKCAAGTARRALGMSCDDL